MEQIRTSRRAAADTGPEILHTREPSLLEAFQQVPDPRGRKGKRYPLASILTLSAIAVMCGARSLLAIFDFYNGRGRKFARALGFSSDWRPCCVTLHKLFRRVDAEALQKAMLQWVPPAPRGKKPPKSPVVEKKRRGRKGLLFPGMDQLIVYSQGNGKSLVQLSVRGSDQTVARGLQALNILPLKTAA